MTKAFRLFLSSQLALYIGLAICVILLPKSLTANGGISYFGNFSLTIIPYALSFILSAGFVVATAKALPITRYSGPVRLGLCLFGACAIGLLITPSMGPNWVSLTHEWIGSVLFFIQLVLSTWLVIYVMRDWLNWILWTIELGGGLAAAFYLNPPTGLLMQSQLVFQIAFGLLLLRTLGAITQAPVLAE